MTRERDEKAHVVGYTPFMRRFSRLRGVIDRHPGITDGVITLVLGGLALLHLSIFWDLVAERALHPALAIGMTVLVVGPLAWRRRFPVAVLLVMTIAILVDRLLKVPEGFSGNAVLLAVLSCAAYGGRWRSWACAASVLALMGYATYNAVITDFSKFEGNQLTLVVFGLSWNYVIFGASWWFGAVLRTRRERTADLEERTMQLEREREENAQRAVLDERVRIARELHDVVAHHVSVMGVQAGAARRILDKQPAKAQEALSSIEVSSRQAVDELHRLLGFLRQDSQQDDLAPQPSLQQLDTLVTEMKEAGLPVEVRIDGEVRPLPPSVDLSAYRIVQEALTNSLKHAGPARASVTLRYTDRAVDLEILDDGRGPAPDGGREIEGRGLVGMRERVSLHGGSLKAGRVPGGGFGVTASLPLAGRAQ
jgi:signal transduction histidine kinase